MEISHREVVSIEAGTSQVLGITDSAPREILIYQDDQKIAKLFIDLNEFEYCRPVGGNLVISQSVVWLRRPSQLVSNSRELSISMSRSLVLNLVLMRLVGDSKRDSVRLFRAFAEKHMSSTALTPQRLTADKENIGDSRMQAASGSCGFVELERRLAEKDAEIDALKQEIVKLRMRIEERLGEN
jgi:hypothetical protein